MFMLQLSNVIILLYLINIRWIADQDLIFKINMSKWHSRVHIIRYRNIEIFSGALKCWKQTVSNRINYISLKGCVEIFHIIYKLDTHYTKYENIAMFENAQCNKTLASYTYRWRKRLKIRYFNFSNCFVKMKVDVK